MAESLSETHERSEDTRQATENIVEEASAGIPRPTTPKRRASYLSPTKASLARSHPNILAISPKRGSLTEPRGKLLRQELLGSRKSGSGLESTTKSTSESLSQESRGQKRVGAPDELDRDGFADAIAQSFRNAPAERSEESENRSATRSPLRIRQPPNSMPSKRRREDKDPSPILPSFPVPTLVRRPDAPVRQKSEARNEPDLPPTPVQLGIGTLPDRPRGLASSSSIGSGSGRHRKRIRSGGAAITSSPLKPKNTRPLSPIDFSDVEDAEIDAVEEAPESDVEEEQARQRQQEVEEPVEVDAQDEQEVAEVDGQDDLPEELSLKQDEFASLRAELERLRKDLASIESLADRLQQGAEVTLADSEIQLLQTNSRKKEQSLQSPDSHPLYTNNISAYLDLFAPGDLQLKYETIPTQIQDRLKVDHHLTLTPPKPWPPTIHHHTLNVRVDVEDARIESIIQKDPTPFSENDNLQEWIKSRLQDPLHQLNATTLVCGIGQYFQACVQRAQFLRAVDEMYNRPNPPPWLIGQSTPAKDKLYLARYFHETEITVIQYVPANGDSSTAPRPSRSAMTKTTKQKIRVDYDIDLTWTGNAAVRIDVTLAGVNAAAQKSAKELFFKLLETEDVLPAFQRVADMLGFEVLAPEVASADSVGVSSSRSSRRDERAKVVES